MAVIIKTKRLTYSYTADDIKEPVLRGIDLEIEEGSFVVVLGSNGSGKSTLAKQFNAILLPEDGKVYVDGMDTSDSGNLVEIRRRVGLVFQNPDNQIVSNVVEEDVAFGLENLGVEPGEIRRRVDAALKTVKMYNYRQHAPHRLSGGQKQRVAIAGVLAMEPRCIVLDEPTAMLDPAGREEVIGTVSDLNKDLKMTAVLITHNMSEATCADRVLVLDEGKIVEDGSPGEVFKKVGRLRELGLAVPDSTRLLWELNKRGVDMTLDAMTPDQCALAISQKLKK